jgi:hypothetical protein
MIERQVSRMVAECDRKAPSLQAGLHILGHCEMVCPLLPLQKSVSSFASAGKMANAAQRTTAHPRESTHSTSNYDGCLLQPLLA